jgi:hypothetical protein
MPTITGAKTATFEFETATGDHTEFAMRLIHLHGGPLRSQSRPRRRPDEGVRAGPFRVATVMIRPAQDRAIADADFKALAFDFRPVAPSRRDRRQL